MKILFITNIPSPYRVDFFNELGKECDLTVIFETSIAKNRDISWLKDDSHFFKSIYLKGIKIGDDGSFDFRIIKYLKTNYDLIILGGYSTPTAMLAILYMKLKKINFVLNADGGFVKDESKILFCIKKYFISSASTWLSTGKKTTQYLLHYGAQKEKIYFYPFTSIRRCEIISKFLLSGDKESIKSKLNIKEEKIILAVGQFIHRKGFDVLLEAASKLSTNYGIYIVGGKVTSEYTSLIEEYNLKNIYFIDFLSKDQLAEYYSIADLFVFPTREDIWGLVINEAMAKGLPIITTDRCIAGLELIREGSNGFIVPVEDIDELAFKIKVILEDNELRENMKKESLKTISRYTIEEMSIRHLEIFQDIKRK